MLISVQNLTFSYDGNYENVFENVSFSIDTNWKLGFIGRNGRGKTTFLNLLMALQKSPNENDVSRYEYSGIITANEQFEYFPYVVNDMGKYVYEVAEEIFPQYEQWQLERELSLLELETTILYRNFNTLSFGERTKVLLAIMFLKENSFMLIDEPTNHLDTHGRNVLAKYLNKKKGFILVSHDRKFLDNCVDHILSINKADITVTQGDFSTWYENKQHRDNFELSENEKLKGEISRLETSQKRTASYAQETEKSKHRDVSQSDGKQDRGFVGHKSAKIMKRATAIGGRTERAIEEKALLLKNIDRTAPLKLSQLEYPKNTLIIAKKLSAFYENKKVFADVSFTIEKGDRVNIIGANGSGKSTLLKILLSENIEFEGILEMAKNMFISYVSQDTSNLFGTLDEFAISQQIEVSQLKTILRKLDFSREQFDVKIENMSGGQKKKVLIASSLCEKSHILFWDEPLNFIDVFSRIQIENLLTEYKPTIIFVEHDFLFCKKIATKTVSL
ncbi:Lsa family ABC-F type ribosomal protection protein [Clostridia bacterium]|nr:Lsa family ABC-F type ribosomal protection protein [Clostridia bacterium]